MAVNMDRVAGPVISVTNGEAGAETFSGSDSRSFNYFKPKGRKASVYEDVTVDVQPDPSRHLLQDWVLGFANGDASYTPDWTRVKSSDWHIFRDPNEQWNRTFYIREANTVRQIQQNLTNAKSEHAFASWDPTWIEVIQNHVSATMHPDHWLGMQVFMPAQRDAMSNMINTAIAVNCMDKLRSAQDLALYNLDLSENLEDFDGSAHKQAWLHDPVWQGARENVERLVTTRDWLEQIFAVNLVYEPLVGELFRSHFVMQVAAPNGDFVTPTLIGVGEYDYERNLRWTMELLRMVSDDAVHGEANRKIMQEWLSHWVPYSVNAARHLQPIWSQPKIKVVRFEDSYDRSKRRFSALLSELHLHLPEEVRL